MGKICLIIALALFCHAQGQTSTAAPTLPKNLVRISTPKMFIAEEDSNNVLLKMEFDGAVPKSRLSKLKTENITTISLVYSRYRLSEMFDQLTLNAQRMDRLYSLMPSLRDNKAIQWYWVEQTGCDNPETCGEYFHGFVITLKSESSELRRESEIDLLEYYTSMYEGSTDTKKMDSLIVARKLPLVKVCDTVIIHPLNKRNKVGRIRGWGEDDKSKLAKHLKNELADSGICHLELIMDRKGQLEFASDENVPEKAIKILKLLNEDLTINPSMYNGKKISSEVTINIETGNKGNIKVFSMIKPVLPDKRVFQLDEFLYTESRTIRCEYKDTTVRLVKNHYTYTTPDLIFKVFDRNKQWKNCLIATDVTGSMYPYLAQFQLWHKLHMAANSGNHDFVFFNDGDNKPDHVKITGSVGGIYYVNADNYEELSKTLNTSMQNGGGGDCPENNIEAVLEGLRKNPSCKEVIMIADNYATPRDLKLLDKVKVPIRLVLCGAQSGINTAYLDMIRKNKGSIHTIEKDLYDLSNLMNGQRIELDGCTYILQEGKFVLQSTRTMVTGR